MATARAGDVIGGGDWSDNRIIPDLVKSLNSGADLEIKNAEAVRPWQSELEPLFGYLNLAEALYQDSRNSYETSFNFGPGKTLTATVNGLVNTAAEIWRKLKPHSVKMLQHEGLRLSLDITKARDLFGWHPRWSFRETVFHTVQWNKSYFGGSNVASLIEEQIDAYLKT